MADRRLQVFHAVAKQLSFTKAAEVLFMTQPAVTFQIKQLEEHFNTRLFDRGHGKISLTPAGETVLEYAERILGLSSELDVRLAEMTGLIGGPLLVGASTTIAEFMLPRILGESLVATLDSGAWTRPKLFDWLQQEGQVVDAEMHRVFNCGIGMVVVVARTYEAQALQLLRAAGETAWSIGRISRRGPDQPQTIVT